MEYIDGMPLSKYISKYGALSLKEATYIIKKIAEGINTLHNLKDQVIHRDLKPENVLLSKDLLKVKLIDFGISTVKGKLANKDKYIQTYEDSLFGTYPYIFPDLKLR
jgi:serine/threonine-protein kinase